MQAVKIIFPQLDTYFNACMHLHFYVQTLQNRGNIQFMQTNLIRYIVECQIIWFFFSA